jgi:hypothetical protein
MQSTLNKLLKVGKPIEIPAPPSFSGVSSDAHRWGIPMTSRYITEVLELPQYAEQFRRFELNGLSLISMDDDHLGPIKFEHSLHCKKLLSHAQQLRESVLEKAAIQCPLSVYEWNTAHVAAWLTYKQACPNVGVHVLRNHIDGRRLLDTENDEELHKLMGSNSKEGEKALKALKQLVAENAHKNHPPPLAEPSELTEPTEPASVKDRTTKKSKAKTAIARRRASEKISSGAMNDDDEEDEPELIVIPSTTLSKILPVIKEDDTHSPQQTESDHEANTLISETNDSKASKKGRKKKATSKSVSPPHQHSNDTDEHILAATNQQILDSLQGRQAPPVTSLPLPDSYSSGHERKKFLEKISSLHETVEQHTVSMNQLHAYAAKLKQENEYFQAEQKQLFLENSSSKQVIANLVADRNAAVGELEKVVGLYQTQSKREQELLRNDIHKLMNNKDQLAYENNTLELNNTLSRTAVANSSTGFDTQHVIIPPPFTQPVRDDSRIIHNELGSSIKNNLNRTAPAALQPSAVGRIFAPGGEGEEEDSDLDDGSPSEAQTRSKSTPRAPSAAPAVGLSVTMPVAVGSSDNVTKQLSSHSPLKATSQSLRTSPPPATTTDSEHISSVEPQTQSLVKEISLLAMVENSAQSERETWQRLINTYSYSKSAHNNVTHIEDTRTLMGRISVLWVRLGLRMLRDAHFSETEKGLQTSWI